LYESTIAALRRDLHDANARIATTDATLAGITLEWERKLAAAVESTRAEQTAAWEVRLGQARALGDEAVARARAEAAAAAVADSAAAQLQQERLAQELHIAQTAVSALESKLTAKEEEAAAVCDRLTAQLATCQAQVTALSAEGRVAAEQLAAALQAADAARVHADSAAAQLTIATSALARSRNDIAAAEAGSLAQGRENGKLLTVIATLEEVVAQEREARRRVERDLRMALQRAAKLSESTNVVPLATQAASKRHTSLTVDAAVVPAAVAGGAALSTRPLASRLLARSFNQHVARQHARAGAGTGSTSAAVAQAWSSSLRTSPAPDAWLRDVRALESVASIQPAAATSMSASAPLAVAPAATPADLLLKRAWQLRSGRAHSADPDGRRAAMPQPVLALAPEDEGHSDMTAGTSGEPVPTDDRVAGDAAGHELSSASVAATAVARATPTPATPPPAAVPSRSVISTPSPRASGRAATAKRAIDSAAATDVEAQLGALRGSVKSSFAAIAALQREKAERDERIAVLSASLDRAAGATARYKVEVSRLAEAASHRHAVAKELQAEGVALWQRLLSLVRALAVALARCGEEAEVDPALLALPQPFTRPLGELSASAVVYSPTSGLHRHQSTALSHHTASAEPAASHAHSVVPLPQALMSPPERKMAELDQRASRSADRADLALAALHATSAATPPHTHAAEDAADGGHTAGQPDGGGNGDDDGDGGEGGHDTAAAAGDAGGDYGY